MALSFKNFKKVGFFLPPPLEKFLATHMIDVLELRPCDIWRPNHMSSSSPCRKVQLVQQSKFFPLPCIIRTRSEAVTHRQISALPHHGTPRVSAHSLKIPCLLKRSGIFSHMDSRRSVPPQLSSEKVTPTRLHVTTRTSRATRQIYLSTTEINCTNISNLSIYTDRDMLLMWQT